MFIELYTDGACKGNPGPGGWGAFLRYGRHEKEMYGGDWNTTNNRMELQAVIEGLAILKEKSSVLITTDSQYVKQGIEQWIVNWKKNGWKTAGKKPVKNKELWQALDEHIQLHTISWNWVKGHSGHPENEKADQLANKGVPTKDGKNEKRTTGVRRGFAEGLAQGKEEGRKEAFHEALQRLLQNGMAETEAKKLLGL